MGNLFTSLYDWIFPPDDKMVVILGLQDAGKTSLFDRMRGDDFKEEKTVTVGFHRGRAYVDNKISINLWDIGGQAKTIQLWKHYLHQASLLIYVIDVANDDNRDTAFDQLKDMLVNINMPFNLNVMQTCFPILIVFNKMDLWKGKPTREELEDKVKREIIDDILLGEEPHFLVQRRKKTRGVKLDPQGRPLPEVDFCYVSAKLGNDVSGEVQSLNIFKYKIKQLLAEGA